jgi:hypothetical protein
MVARLVTGASCGRLRLGSLVQPCPHHSELFVQLRLAAVGTFILPACLLAQTPGPGVGHQHERPITISRAVRTSAPIQLDGRLTEASWATAPVTDSFIQIDPEEGRPASQRTEVRVMYDDTFLYVGVRLYDTGRITGRLGRRDMDFGDSDWFGVMIDSYLDHRTAFGFDVNPAGVRHDEIRTIDVDDYTWDPVWEAATTVDSAGWTAEYRIPFSQLRFSGARAQVWGVQFERIIGRNREYAVSTFIPKSIRGGVPQYGHLLGVEDIRPLSFVWSSRSSGGYHFSGASTIVMLRASIVGADSTLPTSAISAIIRSSTSLPISG